MCPVSFRHLSMSPGVHSQKSAEPRGSLSLSNCINQPLLPGTAANRNGWCLNTAHPLYPFSFPFGSRCRTSAPLVATKCSPPSLSVNQTTWCGSKPSIFQSRSDEPEGDLPNSL